MLNKTCTKCKRILPFDAFSKNKNAPDGHAWECKGCGLAYRQSVRDRLNERNRQYRAANQEKCNEYGRRRYHETQEQQKARGKTYRESHPEKAKEYYQKNRERVLANTQRWREANADSPIYRQKMKEAVQKCRKAKPDLYNSYNNIRRAKVKGNGGSYTAQEWRDLCRSFGNVCLNCRRPEPLVVDHIIPVTKGGTSNVENLQPLCKSCNSRKHNKIIDYRPRVEVEITPLGLL